MSQICPQSCQVFGDDLCFTAVVEICKCVQRFASVAILAHFCGMKAPNSRMTATVILMNLLFVRSLGAPTRILTPGMTKTRWQGQERREAGEE